MKRTARTIAGIRITQFVDAVIFLTEILDLEMVRCDREREFARFELSSGHIMEVYGSRNLWHPFTTPRIGN
ncbi:MAG TPA: hypothetical protein VNJ09_08975 [Chthonomonadales bacterium]|nr:hypothetical protein [Chthonomonadales bacterium]